MMNPQDLGGSSSSSYSTSSHRSRRPARRSLRNLMPKSPRDNKDATLVTRELLGGSLPAIDEDDDKESRGRVLVVGGEVSIPGAVLLAGIAALRAGAGKLQIATCRSIAATIGVAVPEALVLGLDETANGTIAESAANSLRSLTENADAVLIGPG